MVYNILVVVQVVVALSLVGLILVQHGKGADAGAAFGSGASGTVFGAKGSANFMSHATAVLATVFFLASLTLAYLVNGASAGAGSGSITDQLTQQPAATQSVVGGKPAASANESNKSGSASASKSGDAGSSAQKSNNPGPKIPN